MNAFTIRLDDQLHDRLIRAAQADRRSKTAEVEVLLAEALDARDRQAGK